MVLSFRFITITRTLQTSSVSPDIDVVEVVEPLSPSDVESELVAEMSTINVDTIVPDPSGSQYLEIATIKSPYSFQVVFSSKNLKSKPFHLPSIVCSEL